MGSLACALALAGSALIRYGSQVGRGSMSNEHAAQMALDLGLLQRPLGRTALEQPQATCTIKAHARAKPFSDGAVAGGLAYKAGNPLQPEMPTTLSSANARPRR